MNALLPTQRAVRDRLLWPTPAEYRLARLAAGLTQQGASDLTGVARRTLQDWELSVSSPSTLFAARQYIAALNAHRSTK